VPNLAFRIEAIRAERYTFELAGQLVANMNITLGRLERRGEGYSTTFLIRVDYAPPVATVEVKGAVQVTPLSEEERRELEEGASRGQPTPQLLASIYAYTLPILALLAREIGLPPPVPIPVPRPPEQGRQAAPGYV